ncbi:MAG TPA: TonB family protein [Methylomirabilota bacterium]|nr:TonB family protein [Methylomirabilota bacterium]
MPPIHRRFVSIMRSESLPLSALAVSALGHSFLLGGLVLSTMLWQQDQSKVYVVNLVSGIPSLGQATTTPPEAPSLPARPIAPSPPARESKSEVRDRQDSTKQPEPSMPPAPRPGAPTLPRPGEKELPALSHSPVPERRVIAASPVPPIGRPTGSPTAPVNSSISLDAGNFPFAWYIRQMHQKIEAEWNRTPPVARPEQVPIIVVEILRNGAIKAPRIEKSSGNSAYDRAALRAVQDASPFPPLPQEWTKPSLRVGLAFELLKDRG